MKVCSRCKELKNDECFRIRTDKRANNLRYLNNTCRLCEAEKQRAHYITIKDIDEFKIKNRERVKKYRIENPDLYREQQQAKRQKESSKETRRKYIQKNKGKILSQERVCKKRYWEKQKKELTDKYVSVIISQRTPLSRNEIPPALIELKRLELICKRTLKTKTK